MSKPDYKLTIYDKTDGSRCNEAGAAWVQDEGRRISIVINPGVILRRNKDYYITLFKQDGEGYEAPAANDDYEDDIPF